MAELQNLAYIVIGASDLAAWKSFGSDIVGAGVAALAPGSLGLRLDAHPWRVSDRTPNDEDDLTHAGWDLGSTDEDLDEYVATLRDRGAPKCSEEPPQLVRPQRCVKRLFSLADPNWAFVHEFFAEPHRAARRRRQRCRRSCEAR
jgi:hypothetical protein